MPNNFDKCGDNNNCLRSIDRSIGINNQIDRNIYLAYFNQPIIVSTLCKIFSNTFPDRAIYVRFFKPQ